MDRPGIRRAARRGRAGQGEDKVSAPYTGYTIEAGIPFSVLPDAIDPQRMGFDVLVHDSDTQDLSSQSRLGWSTFTGLRADPYR